MGSGALHNAEEIEALLGDGETRLIAAAYRDSDRSGELYVLDDGHAREIRDWAKQVLRCMFSDCPSPDLTTASHARRRDAFVHLRGGGHHAPESINRRPRKVVVAAWLRRRYGAESVAVEATTDTQRSNVADVLLAIGRDAGPLSRSSTRSCRWRHGASGMSDTSPRASSTSTCGATPEPT